MPRLAMERPRLVQYCNRMRDCAAAAVVAPAGFGKTTLLLQWRQRWLEQGARVAWLSVDAQDDPARFTVGLLQATRSACALRDAAPKGRAGLEALTWMLSEIAHNGAWTVIVIDDAERLPEATVRQSLQYLLLNAPSNLHVAIGSRVPLSLQTAELVAKDSFIQLSVQHLRLQLEESMDILERRLGPRLSVDERASVHDATEGWPIGLQLAIAAIEHEADAAAAVRTLSARRGSLQDYFVESLLAALPRHAADVLTRIAILDHFNSELCEAVSGMPSAELLEQLIRETPIMMVGEREGWLRLHPLARDFLRGRFEQLPEAERCDLHARASRWYMQRERLHDAANHALAAGDEALAQEYAARALWMLGALGKVDEAREWLARLPMELLSRDPELRLGAAVVLAFSDRNAEGLKIATDVLADPATPPELAVVARRVASTSAVYADQLGLLENMLAVWPPVPANVNVLYTANRLNVGAFVAFHRGDTERTRMLLAQLAALGREGSLHLAHALSRMLVGLSHLWDGNPRLAEEEMRPALLLAEREEGRRSMIACLHASVLAAALLQLDQPAAAEALLANRLDVIERCGFPDNILVSYRTLVYAALAQSDERRAFSVLDSLDAVAHRRGLPRLRVQSLAERIRLLALRQCHQTAGEFMVELDALAAAFEQEGLRPFLPQYRLVVAVARSYIALARGDCDEAERSLDAAAILANSLHRGRDARAIKVLRAVAARQRGSDQALPLLMEAMSLASLSGNARLLANTHPLALEMAVELKEGALLPKESTRRPAIERGASSQSGLLTTKESEILRLLQRGMSNKRIALTLDIGGETVKWHLKNLYAKLSAVSREHAVDRARLLGLVQ
ncbi:LuxR C-terminal-related transcriptional regulator [Lysobacter terrae]